MLDSLSRCRAVVIALAVCCIARAAKAQVALDAELKAFLTRYELPALAAVVAIEGRVVAVGAVGTRRTGTKTPVTVNDRFHLGSDTKAMTALLAAMYVEEGKLRWRSTVAEVFPKLVAKMDSRLQRVTLEQILSHTSGIPSDNDAFKNVVIRSVRQDGNLDDLRYWLVGQWCTQPLESKPGTKFAYANMGYTLVGAMVERVAGKTWDELITERIFTPLGLRTAGLGPQASPGKVDAPLGHQIVDGKIKAFLAGPDADVPLIIGPAGIAHMSILDFARWAAWNAGEGKRGPLLVRPETLRKLHTPVVSMPTMKDPVPGRPPGGRYGLGWGELPVAWAPRPLLYHGGSNGKNLAHIWLDTKRDYAMVTATNIATRKADEGLFSLARVLYSRFAGGTRGGG